MKNLIENKTDDFLHDYQKTKDVNMAMKLVIVILMALLLWQSNDYSNYKRDAESKSERDLQSINAYKDLVK